MGREEIVTEPNLTGTIHLVRHGEVENPRGIIYGRLPGYNLSERGLRQVADAGVHLASAPIGAVWTSPLERAQETAAAVAQPHDLDPVIDDRLIESDTTLEGVGRTMWRVFRNPTRWWQFRNPMRPSWGESFDEVKARMVAAITDAMQTARGKDLVIVSHQTPVMVVRNALARRRTPPWWGRMPCETGSVTTIVLDEGAFVSAKYFRSDAR
jgi:broad specificity phosphatase PhoE